MTTSVIEWCDANKKLHKKNILGFTECEFSQVSSIIVSKCYNMSLNAKDYTEILEYILSQMIYLTKSEIGGICEKTITPEEDYLKFIVLSEAHMNQSIEYDSELNNLLSEKDNNKNIKFHSTELNDLLGRSITHNTIIISNDIKNDPRSKGVPKNHFILEKFLGIPLIINDICIGQILLANKKKQYSEYDIYNIYVLIRLVSDTIFNVYHNKKYTISEMLQDKCDIKKTKDDFLARMSHEIRTPLTGIMGAVTLLPQIGALNEKQLSHLKIATTCSVQLLDLINGILDFSRLTSGTLTLLKESFNFKKCIDTSITIVESRAKAKKLSLKVDISKDIPLLILGDHKRLTQILVNLLTNAIKFTDKGYIKLNINPQKYKNNKDSYWKLEFNIEDTGIGIDKNDQTNIFSVFCQLSNQTAYNKQDGAGLGLAISKELVELMGGKLEVYSCGRGKGSIFSFYINVEENIDAEQILKKYNKPLTSINILNVDDKIENLLILDELLGRWKINTIMCVNAEQALRYLEKGTKFDLAIIDIYMPYMSGIELAQRLRSLYPSLPLIAISSGDNYQGKEWFDDYLIKPYNQTHILKSILNCINLKPKKLSIQKNNKVKPTKQDLKILLAEDDVNAQFMIKEMILSLGYNIEKLTTVSNGQEAVDTAKKECFDVCLMDVKMPIMDGLEASKYIKQLPDRPFIVAISAGVMDSDKTSCLKAGMDGYLGKPFGPEELNNVLKRFIN